MTRPRIQPRHRNKSFGAGRDAGTAVVPGARSPPGAARRIRLETMPFLFFRPCDANRIFMSRPPPLGGHSRVGGKNEIGFDNVWRPRSRGLRSDAFRRGSCGLRDVDRACQFDGADSGSFMHVNARKPGCRAMCAACEISVPASIPLRAAIFWPRR